MVYKKPTIRELGLRTYLGDKLYTEFVYHYKYQSLLVEGTDQHINATAIGKAIGVNYRTARSYMAIYEEEQAHKGGTTHAKSAES